ncbi:DUF6301 family protein [Nocardia sp. NPDC055029]
MRFDLDGAMRALGVVREFDWSWTEGDLIRFASAAGWAVAEIGAEPLRLSTDLDVEFRDVHSNIGPIGGKAGRESLNRIIFEVAGVDSVDSTSAAELVSAFQCYR